jgi:hypothetical protein
MYARTRNPTETWREPETERKSRESPCFNAGRMSRAPAFAGPLHLFEEETKKDIQKVPFAFVEIKDFLKKIS